MEESADFVDMRTIRLSFDALSETPCCSTVQQKKLFVHNPSKITVGDVNSWHNGIESSCCPTKECEDTGHFKCIQTDNVNLFLSDMLIGSAEQMRWNELKMGCDFKRPIEPRQFLEKLNDFCIYDSRPSSSCEQGIPNGIEEAASSSVQKHEGNSIFYEYSTPPRASCQNSDEPSTSGISRGDVSSAYDESEESTRTSSIVESSQITSVHAATPPSKAEGKFDRESIVNALFSKYFGQKRLQRSSSIPDRFTQRSVMNGLTVASEEEEREAYDGGSGEESSGEDLKCVATFADFPQDLVAIPDEIRLEHRLIRTASGRELIRRRRRRSSSSSSSASSNSLRRSWAPPKRKFIFDISHVNYKDFATMLSRQDNRCAGCSRKFNNIYAKRSRICYYFSKLFCQCCHQGGKFVIPAQILHNWNFKELLVCDTALRFLHENADQPVFNVAEINPQLYAKVKAMRKVRDLRTQASHMWQYVQLCPNAEEFETGYGYLKTMFTSVARRFLALESVHVFSILDLVSVFNRNLIETLEPIVYFAREHIEHCTECQQRAFICQLCSNEVDLLFPFQLERVYRCEGCGALSHSKCHVAALKARRVTADNEAAKFLECAKCERIRRKRIRQFQRSPSRTSDKFNSE